MDDLTGTVWKHISDGVYQVINHTRIGEDPDNPRGHYMPALELQHRESGEMTVITLEAFFGLVWVDGHKEQRFVLIKPLTGGEKKIIAHWTEQAFGHIPNDLTPDEALAIACIHAREAASHIREFNFSGSVSDRSVTFNILED